MPTHTDFITNNEYPTLCIKGFGKIENAEIELAPFTLFVGDNNSGKSYLMNLIWVLKENAFSFIHTYSTQTQQVKGFFEKHNTILNNILTKEESSAVFSGESIKYLLTELNTILDQKKQEIIQYALNDDHTSISSLQLKISQDLISRIKINVTIRKKTDTDNNFSISTNFGRVDDPVTIVYQEEIDSNMLQNHIFGTLLQKLFYILIKSHSSTFFPASRTSFLLSYPLLASSAWKAQYNKQNFLDDSEPNNISFLRSVNSFVDDLMRLPMLRSKMPPKRMPPLKKTDTFEKYCSFIEQNIIKGKINIDEETKAITYTPSNSDISLPLHATSSVVTEITPLLLFFRHGVLRSTLFMEEPEISLHLELQQQLTRLFIKMVNEGRQVFLTTHSDTIIQHINNMIKLFKNPKERQATLLEKFQYNEEDIIDPDKIRIYQFNINPDNSKTTIRPLKIGKYGFIVPTFGEFLDKISEEVDEFLEEL